MRHYQAHIEREPYMDGYRLHIWARNGDRSERLCEDGTWKTVQQGEYASDAGFILPRDAWQAIVDIAAPHADAGEVKALRDALALEQSRVEKIIDKAVS